ncbi:unnamed protein product [marine sediment metagenome]|uniref:Uncharacterized protein n=1 Tax=marine sediment metagenome TaxID=412755 RepID=X1TUD6_9ZZZZ
MEQAREGEERGRGIPLDDAQRIARHYGVTIEEACDLLRTYSVEELLPERGYGLTAAAQVVGYSLQDLQVALNTMEESLPEGGKAKLEICTEALPTEEDLATAYLNMAGAGFHTSYPSARIVQGVPTTQFSLQKGSPQWALLIPLLPTALIVGLIAFGLVRIEEISKALLPLMITGAVGLVGVALIVRKPAERIAERYLPKV